MSSRKVPIATGEIYHVYNRSIAREPIFLSRSDYQRALNIISYYIYQKPTLRFSHYNRLSVEQKQKFLDNLKEKGVKQVEILAFCLMPNHFHFLLKEIVPHGISNFIRNFQNSYAKFFNLKNERDGSLFKAMFKAVRIESDEQLLHVQRYIHLNPLTAFILKDEKALETYPWSSFTLYLDDQTELIERTYTDVFLKTKEAFKNFTYDQIDYQRTLGLIKHLSLE